MVLDYYDPSEIARREAELALDNEWPGELPEHIEEWNALWFIHTMDAKTLKWHQGYSGGPLNKFLDELPELDIAA
jgi:hypothetical protein